MLDYSEWCRAVYERKTKLAEIDDQMRYRKIKLRGPVAPEAMRLMTDPVEIYGKDATLIELEYKRARITDELKYLETVGDYPPDAPEKYNALGTIAP